MRAFGLASDADADDLLERLRTGGAIDAQILRAGCEALVQRLRDDSASTADHDRRVAIALKAAQVSFWDLDLRTREIFVDHTCFELIGLPRPDGTLPIAELEELTHPD